MTLSAAGLHVLVIFSCDDGRVERLALQSAVGAVQARAAIRLRRITRSQPASNVEALRMDQDYIAPRPEDLDWADGIVFAVPAGELRDFLATGARPGKPALALLRCDAILQQAGFHVVQFSEDADRTDPAQCLQAGRLFAQHLWLETRSRVSGSTL